MDTSPADVLNVSMEWTDVGIILTGHLGGDPRTVDGFTYSYWIGFLDGGRSGGGNPPTWTWQGDSLYERISTMYWDGPDWYEVVWADNAFRFLIPWIDFENQYGANSTGDIGSPRISTSGPVPMGTGTNNPSQDSAYYSLDLVPMGPCETEVAMVREGLGDDPSDEDQTTQTTALEGPVDDPSAEDQKTPGPSLLITIGGLMFTGYSRRRWRQKRCAHDV